MTNARLHVNCDGCGNSTLFTYETIRDWLHDNEESLRDETIIYCLNCNTAHFLSQLLHERPKRTDKGKERS